MSAPVSIPLRELGAVGGGGAGWWSQMARETTPELRWPASIGVFDRMGAQETQIASVLRAVTEPIMRTKWRIAPAGARDEVTEHVARDLGLPIKGEAEEDRPRRRLRGRFSWNEHLRLANLDLQFGFMAFEQLARIDPVTGRAHLRKLAPRFPDTIVRINQARDGGLESIEQRTWPGARSRGGAGTARIPVSRLVMYTHDRRADWYGRSLLRPAYKYWVLKDNLLRIQSQVIERNGMGIPVYTDGPDNNYRAEGEKLATELRAGTESGAGLPHGALLRLLGVEGHLVDAMPVIRYYDEQMARMVLAHALNLGQQTGSWALGRVFMDLFVLSLQGFAETKRDVGQAHVVEDIVDWNWGPDEVAPQLECDEIGAQHPATALAIKQLLESGALSQDPRLEQYLRQQFGLPPRGAEEDEDDQPPAPPPPAPGTGDDGDQEDVA